MPVARNLSWVKIFNVDQSYEANRINGHLQAKLVYYLLNIHTLPRHIYLCRVCTCMPCFSRPFLRLDYKL